MKNLKVKGRIRRSIRIRNKIAGTQDRPRLTVFRSNRFIYAQIINDLTGETLVFADERKLLDKESAAQKKQISKTERASVVGRLLAQRARKKKVDQVVFDRNGYKYHGRVKALAEAARAEGLKF